MAAANSGRHRATPETPAILDASRPGLLLPGGASPSSPDPFSGSNPRPARAALRPGPYGCRATCPASSGNPASVRVPGKERPAAIGQGEEPKDGKARDNGEEALQARVQPARQACQTHLLRRCAHIQLVDQTRALDTLPAIEAPQADVATSGPRQQKSKTPFPNGRGVSSGENMPQP